MKKMVPSGLDELMARHDIIVAVVVAIDTGEKEVAGDRTALESDYSLRVLFDDLTVSQIEEYLEGQLLPRMSQQGKVCGVICKPTENMIVGLYYHDERHVFQRSDASNIIDAEIRKLCWESPPR